MADKPDYTAEKVNKMTFKTHDNYCQFTIVTTILLKMVTLDKFYTYNVTLPDNFCQTSLKADKIWQFIIDSTHYLSHIR